MDRSRIAIVIPALNEQDTIGTVVREASRHGVVIVVNDGSRDATAERAASAGADVVSHPSNRGYDGALNSGFVRAAELGAEYVITLDADGQHDPATVRAFVDALDEGADIVVGIRDRRQRLGEVLFGWASTLRWGVRDPLCGLKAYRIGLWKEAGAFDTYQSIGTALTVHAARTGKRIAQRPVKTADRADVAPRFGRRFSANRRILRAMWRGMTRPAQGR